MMLEVKSQLEKRGYFTGWSITAEETRQVLSFLEERWLETLTKNYPDKVNLFKEAGIENYHIHSSEVDHRNMWPRNIRLFSSEAQKYIKESSLFSMLCEVFGDFGISDESSSGHGGLDHIMWRLVRPDEKNDINFAHADFWFKDINQWEYPENTTRYEVWVPLICENGKNGLTVVPKSHLHPELYPHSTGESGDALGTYAGVPKFDEKEVGLELIPTDPGDIVIFHDKLLHKGSINRGSKCRLSFELTMVVSNEIFQLNI